MAIYVRSNVKGRSNTTICITRFLDQIIFLQLYAVSLPIPVTGFVPVFEQKNSRIFQGLSRTHFPYFKDSIQFKKSLNSMSFLVLPQHR